MYTREEKKEAGYESVIAYWEGRNEEEKKSNTIEMNKWLTRHRYYTEKEFYDIDDDYQYYQILNMYRVRDKRVVIMTNRPPKEKEYIWMALSYRGAKSVEFTDGYEPTELTRYLAGRMREDLKVKMKRGCDDFIEKGESIFTQCPYGYYRYRKKLRIDNYEAFIVKYVFYRTSQGANMNEIKKELNDRGFRNRRDKMLTRYTIREILRNYKIYQGYCEFKGTEYKGNHTPLIDENKYPIGIFDYSEAKKMERQGRKKKR